MDNKAFVGGGKATRDLQSVIGSLRNGDGTLGKTPAQGLALQQFGDNIRGGALKADIINGEDVGVIQGGGGARFLLESAQVIGIVAGSGPNQLEGNVATQTFVTGAKDIAHPP